MPCKFWRRLVELWQLWQLWLFDLIGTWVVRWLVRQAWINSKNIEACRRMMVSWLQNGFNFVSDGWNEIWKRRWTPLRSLIWAYLMQVVRIVRSFFRILDQPSGASLQNSLRCELQDEMVAKCGCDASLIQPLWMGRVKQSETVEENSSSARNDSPNFVKICLYIVFMDFQFLADSSWDSVWDRGHHLARKGDTNGWW